MGEEIPLLPETQPTDDEDVAWGLQTAAALWARGERKEALVWVRRAAEAATAAGDDARALELTKRGAALEQHVARAEVAPASVAAPSQAQPRPLISFPEPGERTPPIPMTAPSSSAVPPASRTIPMHGGPPLSARHFDDEPTSDYDGELEPIDDRVSLPLLEDDAIKEEGDELTVPRLDIIKMQKALDERAAAGPKSSAVPQPPNVPPPAPPPPAPAPQAPPLTQTQPMAHVLAAAASAAAANAAASAGPPASHTSAMQMQPPIVIESSHDTSLPLSERGASERGPASGSHASQPQTVGQSAGPSSVAAHAAGPHSSGPQSQGPQSQLPQSQGPNSTRAVTKAPPPPPPRGRTPTLQPGGSGSVLPATPMAPPVAPGPPPSTTTPASISGAAAAPAPAPQPQAAAAAAPQAPQQTPSPTPAQVSGAPQPAAQQTPPPPAVAALTATGNVELRSATAEKKKKGRAPILDPWADDFPIDDPPPNNLRASHHALDMGLGSEDDVVTSAAPLETTLRRKPPPPPVRPKAPAPGTILADSPPVSTPDPTSRPNGESQAPHRPPPPPPPPMRRSATLTGTPNPLWTPPAPTVAERKSAPPPAPGPASERKSVPPAPPVAATSTPAAQSPAAQAPAAQSPTAQSPTAQSPAAQALAAPEHRKSIPPVEPQGGEGVEAAPRSVSARSERTSQLPPAPPVAPPAPTRAKTAPPPAPAAPAAAQTATPQAAATAPAAPAPPAGPSAAPTMPAGPAPEPASPAAPPPASSTTPSASVRPPPAPPRPASTPPAARPKSAPPAAAPAPEAAPPPATIPPAERSVAGLTLDRVEAFADLPGELQKVLAASATIVELGDSEEVKGFGTLLVVSGVVDVCATIADIAAAMIAEGGIVPARTSIDDNVSLRAVAPSKAKVATWTREAMDDALRTCPWVLEELVRMGDRFAALVGATMGPIGDLDDESRRQTLDRFRVRALRAGEVLAEKGAENPGLVVVGAGALEVGDDDGALDSLNGGDLLYPNTVLDGSPLPHRVRAGDKGALLLVASRSTTVELFSTLPMLLELLRVA